MDVEENIAKSIYFGAHAEAILTNMLVSTILWVEQYSSNHMLSFSISLKMAEVDI